MGGKHNLLPSHTAISLLLISVNHLKKVVQHFVKEILMQAVQRETLIWVEQYAEPGKTCKVTLIIQFSNTVFLNLIIFGP